MPAGTTLTWRWEAVETHNAVGGGLPSGNLVEGTVTYPFAEPGTYAYRCALHVFMRGEVVVTE